MTVPANLAGLPAISVPVARASSSSTFASAFSSSASSSASSAASAASAKKSGAAAAWSSPNRGLPLGLQLIGRAFDESTLLRAAAELERCAQFEALPFRASY
jgi:Asp-tRNA(Asn)/Glu-tRNA(Gln) amidotransferase A subunit family amidase